MNLIEAAVVAVMDQVANDIIDRLNPPDEGVRDVINLMVNATAHRLDYPEDTLEEAIIATYNEEPDVVLDWCRVAC